MRTPNLLRPAVLLTLVAGCARPSVSSPLPREAAAALAWLPSDVALVNHQAPPEISLLAFARSALKEKVPPCFDRIAGQVDHLFMLSRFMGDPAVNAVHGLADRSETERCAATVYFDLTGQSVTMKREGALTRASSERGVLFLGWSGDGWLYFHADRDQVQRLLARPPAPTLAPGLRPLLARVGIDGEGWTVFAGDALGPFVGVPSRGFIQRLAIGSSKDGTLPVARGMPVSLLFDGQQGAHRAREAIAAAGRDETLPAPIRAAVSRLPLAIRGAELEIDVATIFTDLPAMEAAARLLQQRAKRR